MPHLYAACLVLLLAGGSWCRAQSAVNASGGARLEGRVVDARTGEPISKVKVIAVASRQSATTDEDGGFTLENLPPGAVELYITTIDYGLVKKTVTLREGANPREEIALNQEAATLAEQVTVTAADPFEGAGAPAPSEQTINKVELRTLSTVILGDPVRAAQALPGAAAGDDFRSEFAVRGAGFDRVGLYLDGVLVDQFTHTVQGGYLDSGSLSVLNADAVGALSLFGGAFPAAYGDRTAAILDVETREGNRLKPAGRFAASLSNVSGVVDGPLDGGRGSWLFAARQSYLGRLVRRVNRLNDNESGNFAFDFSDVQGRVVDDLSPRHQLGFAAIFGASQYDRDRPRDRLGVNTVRRGDARNLLLNAHWTFTPSAKLLTRARLFAVRQSFANTNRDDQRLDEGTRMQFGGRADVDYLARPAHRLAAGLYLRSVRTERTSRRYAQLSTLSSFNRRAAAESLYLQDTWTSERLGLSLTGGGRVEHSGLTGETLFSPRAALGLRLGDAWRLRAGLGRYHQFPDFDPLFGRLGHPGLRAESATHYNASIERTFGERTRLLAEVYDREDRRLFFSLSEPRLVAGRASFFEFPFRNALNGHARGGEISLQRRSANGLSGWASYAYARTLLRDRLNDLAFVSDYDQRHTVNVYGNYRFTETFNLSGQWRYGSGFPVPGFFRREGDRFFLAAERNRARVPAYSRLDLRASKAFLFTRWKLTLSGELLNLFNRANLRYAGFDGYGPRGEVFGSLDKTLPFLPSAGVVVEF